MDMQLPREIESYLRQQAAKAGMKVEEFTLAALQHGPETDQYAADVMLPRDQWKAKFDALLASFPTRSDGIRVDASRESIYGDRR